MRRALAVALSSLVCVSAAVAGESLVKDFWVTSNPKESPQKVKEKSEQAAQALADFKSLTFLEQSDSKIFQQNLESLIGNYFYVEGAGTPQAKILPVGLGNLPARSLKTELKDSIIFRGVVNKKWNAGLGLPFLEVKLDSSDVAEMTIQDVLSVAAEKPLADEIGCGFPKVFREKSKTTDFYYITGAAVISISSRRFTTSDAGGNGAFSIIKLNGQNYSSDEEFVRKNVIAISKVPALPLGSEDCKAPAAAAEGERSVTAMRSLGEEEEAAPSGAIFENDTKVPALMGAPIGISEPKMEP